MTDQIICCILWVQPVRLHFIRQDHRHPVMNESNAVSRCAGQNGEYGDTLLQTVDARHVQDPPFVLAYGILDLLSATLFPFEVVCCRNEAPPLCHTILEHWAGRRRFAACIEHYFPIWQRVAPFHHKCRQNQRSIIGENRSDISRPNLAFLIGAPLFLRFTSSMIARSSSALSSSGM